MTNKPDWTIVIDHITALFEPHKKYNKDPKFKKLGDFKSIQGIKIYTPDDNNITKLEFAIEWEKIDD